MVCMCYELKKEVAHKDVSIFQNGFQNGIVVAFEVGFNPRVYS